MDEVTRGCDAILHKLYLGASCALWIMLVGGHGSQDCKGPAQKNDPTIPIGLREWFRNPC